jgi:hypothetical protein
MHASHQASRGLLLGRLARSAVLHVVCLTALLTLGDTRRVWAQPIDEAVLNAMVQIVATRAGETLRGTGFVVALDRDRSIATIITSAHVVVGAKLEA